MKHPYVTGMKLSMIAAGCNLALFLCSFFNELLVIRRLDYLLVACLALWIERMYAELCERELQRPYITYPPKKGESK